MRNKFIAGNWKMNNGRAEARDLIRGVLEKTASITKTTIMVAPPFSCLETASELLRGSRIGLGAQNLFWEDKGAFTGEISPVMLKDAGCKYVIIGHSERRQYFSETDQTVNRKIAAALKHGLLPVVCVGETLAQRESGSALKVVEQQVRQCLDGYSAEQAGTFTIAYEPVWAIGTGRAATAMDAVEVHTHIRSTLTQMFGADCARKVRIQYGGSVTADNIEGFIRESEIDGALVGGACLKAESFARIISAAENV
ncbi:MAG TPA: triose-phosphate isomerase [Acidobacteriota bacterium]|nr:triose-phosphate isomerase [Acidobacteriota bacterium]